MSSMGRSRYDRRHWINRHVFVNVDFLHHCESICYKLNVTSTSRDWMSRFISFFVCFPPHEPDLWECFRNCATDSKQNKSQFSSFFSFLRMQTETVRLSTSPTQRRTWRTFLFFVQMGTALKRITISCLLISKIVLFVGFEKLRSNEQFEVAPLKSRLLVVRIKTSLGLWFGWLMLMGVDHANHFSLLIIFELPVFPFDVDNRKSCFEFTRRLRCLTFDYYRIILVHLRWTSSRRGCQVGRNA